MEPILTLPYSEWLVAEVLMRAFPSREGYSVYAPLSRQEKEVDLLLTHRARGTSRAAALQIKYSRAYEQGPRAPFRFVMWFRSFPVGDRADFFVLAGLYPNIVGSGASKRESSWLRLLLILGRQEMAELVGNLRTRSGNPDRMFYLAFDAPDRVTLTRGAADHRDFTSFAFANRISLLRNFLGAA